LLRGIDVQEIEELKRQALRIRVINRLTGYLMQRRVSSIRARPKQVGKLPQREPAQTVPLRRFETPAGKRAQDEEHLAILRRAEERGDIMHPNQSQENRIWSPPAFAYRLPALWRSR
jgi:hypothetical protein